MTKENSDRPFVLEDCPKNENGHWMAKTRGGRDVLIYTDKHVDEPYSILGCYVSNICIAQWRANGQWSPNGDISLNDLVSPRKTVTVDFWVNVYSDHEPISMWKSRMEALLHADKNSERYGRHIACIRVTREVEEGEGL